MQWPHGSALASGLNDLGLSPGWEYFTVSLGKTLYSHSGSLHQGVLMGIGELMLGVR